MISCLRVNIMLTSGETNSSNVLGFLWVPLTAKGEAHGKRCKFLVDGGCYAQVAVYRC